MTGKRKRILWGLASIVLIVAFILVLRGAQKDIGVSQNELRMKSVQWELLKVVEDQNAMLQIKMAPEGIPRKDLDAKLAELKADCLKHADAYNSEFSKVDLNMLPVNDRAYYLLHSGDNTRLQCSGAVVDEDSSKRRLVIFDAQGN